MAPRVSSLEPRQTSSNGGFSPTAIAAIFAAIAAILSLVLILALVLRRRKRKQYRKMLEDATSSRSQASVKSASFAGIVVTREVERLSMPVPAKLKRLRGDDEFVMSEVEAGGKLRQEWI
ncbi:hypothetical protein BS50DRAFT_575508 [Corynespora cassiicola Philippines]|uniref:Uncharacterized protein n=1 Tax=Corynespora cassiicola Philippines TaxID=1448308 RepID=A0A2T2NJ96_CORCC|nr:hypothetical protein BS50DRAFT_575508 [Corynespora cassiicola Philippines]